MHILTIMQLIEGWHQQDRMHAGMHPPQCLVLQAGRFSFDAHTVPTTQQRFFVFPDERGGFAVHCEGVGVTHVAHQLKAFAFRGVKPRTMATTRPACS